MADHDAEMDALLDMLEAAGLAERYVTEDGAQAMRLTPKGAQVARQMSMSTEGDALGLLTALLDAAGEEDARPSRDGR
jgi:hypothetical protein